MATPGCDTFPNPPCQVRDGFGFDPVTGLPIAGQANIVPRVASILEPQRFSSIIRCRFRGAQKTLLSTTILETSPTLFFPISSISASTTPSIPNRMCLAAGRTRTGERSTPSTGLLLPAETDFEHDNQIVLAHNYAITPNLINELRGGISRVQLGGNFPLDGPAFMQQLGLNPDQLDLSSGGFPDFVFEPRGGIDAIVHTRPDPQLYHNFQINENLTWTKGKHTLKFGFDVRRLHLVTAWYSGSSAADDYGDFFFNGQYTGNGIGHGNNFADFLLGVPYFTYVTHTPPRNIDGKTTHYYAYASDTFRATQKLTLDFGVRMSRMPPLYDPINLTNFDPSVAGTGQVIISSDPRSLAATQPLWAQAVNACNTPNDIPGYAGPDPNSLHSLPDLEAGGVAEAIAQHLQQLGSSLRFCLSALCGQ